MKKTWIALLLALCMLFSTATAFACCTDDCCTNSSGMDETQTMEETCPCMMDGKSCMMDGMRSDECMCEAQCACADDCACAEHKLEMLYDELNAVFEMHMETWEKFFGMLDKEPDLSIPYPDYLTEQLEMMKEEFAEEEYGLLQMDIEEIRRIYGEITMLMEALAPDEALAATCMADGECVPECACEEGSCTEACGCMAEEMDQSAEIKN